MGSGTETAGSLPTGGRRTSATSQPPRRDEYEGSRLSVEASRRQPLPRLRRGPASKLPPWDGRSERQMPGRGGCPLQPWKEQRAAPKPRPSRSRAATPGEARGAAAPRGGAGEVPATWPDQDPRPTRSPDRPGAQTDQEPRPTRSLAPDPGRFPPVAQRPPDRGFRVDREASGTAAKASVSTAKLPGRLRRLPC